MSVSWGIALKVWWSAAWRGFLYGLVGGFVLGFVGGIIAAAIHAPEKAVFFGNIGGLIAAIPASMLGFKQALSKHLPVLAKLVAQPTLQADPPASGGRSA
jgi:hypothetical protein